LGRTEALREGFADLSGGGNFWEQKQEKGDGKEENTLGK